MMGRVSARNLLTWPECLAILCIYIGDPKMIARVQKWGNSQGLRLSKQMLAEAEISIGDEVNVAVRDGLILIAPVKRLRGKYRLGDLIKRIPAGNDAQEIQWGEPVGNEVW